MKPLIDFRMELNEFQDYSTTILIFSVVVYMRNNYKKKHYIKNKNVRVVDLLKRGF